MSARVYIVSKTRRRSQEIQDQQPSSSNPIRSLIVIILKNCDQNLKWLFKFSAAQGHNLQNEPRNLKKYHSSLTLFSNGR